MFMFYLMYIFIRVVLVLLLLGRRGVVLTSRCIRIAAVVDVKSNDCFFIVGW